MADLVGSVADVYVGADFTLRARLDLASLWTNGCERTPLADLPFAPR